MLRDCKALSCFGSRVEEEEEEGDDGDEGEGEEGVAGVGEDSGEGMVGVGEDLGEGVGSLEVGMLRDCKALSCFGSRVEEEEEEGDDGDEGEGEEGVAGVGEDSGEGMVGVGEDLGEGVVFGIGNGLGGTTKPSNTPMAEKPFETADRQAEKSNKADLGEKGDVDRDPVTVMEIPETEA
nr:hypothetical protein CFP56_23022 [Quercus suber]